MDETTTFSVTVVSDEGDGYGVLTGAGGLTLEGVLSFLRAVLADGGSFQIDIESE